jgi:hypothetical protein
LDYKETALMVKEQAEAVKIVDQFTYDHAVEGLKAASALEKQIIEHHAPMKADAFKAHQTICQKEKELLAPVQAAKGLYSRAIGTWDAEQRRKEEEERRRLEAEERKRQDEAALAEAVAAQEEGATEDEVMAVLESPRAMPKVAPVPGYVRAAGIRPSTHYSAEQVSFEQLVKAAAANPKAYLSYLLPNMSVINGLARTQKEMFNVPGFRLKKSTTAGTTGR